MKSPPLRAVILTALTDEFQAVRAHLHDIKEEVHPQGTVYECGVFDENSQPWEILIAQIGAGNEPAAAGAERAIAHFKPHVALFVGVAGGIKNVFLGDVVVSTKAHDYSQGKADIEFLPRPDSERATYRLGERARAESRSDDWHKRIKSNPVSRNPKGIQPPTLGVPKAVLGPIASGPNVVSSHESDQFKLIKRVYGDAIAVEMEGHGHLLAVRTNPGVEGLVVRGISDLVENKTEGHDEYLQPLAARHAAAFAFQVLAKFDGTATTGPLAGVASVPVAQLDEIKNAQEAIANDSRQEFEEIKGKLDHILNLVGGEAATASAQNLSPLSGAATSSTASTPMDPLQDLSEPSKPSTQPAESSGPNLRLPKTASLAEFAVALDLASTTLNEKAVAWSGRIRSLLYERDFEKAFEEATALETWLKRAESHLSHSSAGEIYLRLAHVAIIRGERVFENTKHADFALAKKLMQSAEGLLTRDPAPLSEVESWKLYVEFLETASETVLSQLTSRKTPFSTRRSLVILLRKSRSVEAIAIIEKSAPHEQWCDLAITALIEQGKIEDAGKMLEWGQRSSDVGRRRRCIVSYAEAMFRHALRNRSEESPLLPGAATATERKEFSHVVDVLEPMIAAMVEAGVQTKLEIAACWLAMQAQHVLGNRTACQRIGQMLAGYRPIPPEMGEAVLRRIVKSSEDLPSRLRVEHPQSLEAHLRAALIEAEIQRKPKDAFAAAIRLQPMATKANETDALAHVLYQIAQEAGGEALSQFKQLAPALMKENSQGLVLMQAGIALSEQNLEQARALLENIRNENDPKWLQVYGHYLLQSGNEQEAINLLAKAMRKLPHPDLLQMVSELAYRHTRLDVAKEALELAISVDPTNVRSHHNLGTILAETGDYLSAVHPWKALFELEPANLPVGLNYAITLALSDQRDESLKVYESLCQSPTPPLRAILGRAQVLRSLDRTTDAMNSLKPWKERFWEDVPFVMAYMDLGYASGDEVNAHDAFARLLQLQSEGKVGPEQMQAKSLDEIVGFMKQGEDRHKLLKQQEIVGKAPWLMVDELLGNVSYWGWRIRTQRLDWIIDDEIQRASYCIYSTNSLTPRVQDDGTASLENIQAPPAGSTVVIDLSTIITLHRLGLLQTAADYFEKIIVPATYSAKVLEEAGNLVLHQKSQRTSLEQILECLNSGQIQVVADQKSADGMMLPLVDEYGEGGGNSTYRLKDILAPMAGKIRDSALADLERIARKDGAAQHGAAKLPPGQRLIFELGTLQTLASLGVMETVLRIYGVNITTAARTELMARTGSYRARMEVIAWHADMWKSIRDNNKFIYTAAKISPEMDNKQQQVTQDTALAGAFLSNQLQVPLLADDRVSQMLVLNARKSDRFATFGTDQLLQELGGSGRLPWDRVADHFLTLLDWRYRFLIVPSKVLKALTDASRKHPPGEALRSVARYAHDCMHDAGLFSGPEPVDPPMPLSFKLFQSWTGSITEFLIALWEDKTYTVDECKLLTRWSITELLPPFPKNLTLHFQARMADFTARLVIGKALVPSAHMKSVERANGMLVAIVQAFGLDEDEYLRICLEVIDGV